MNGKALIVTCAVVTVFLAAVTGQPILGLLIGTGIGVTAEVVLGQYYRARRLEQLANRRDCLAVIQNWPDEDGHDIDLDDGEGTYADLYVVVDDPAALEDIARERREELAAAGNACCLPDVADDLRLPVFTIYAKAGGNRMQRRGEYLDMCRAEITRVNNQFHQSQQSQADGAIYQSDVLSRRRIG